MKTMHSVKIQHSQKIADELTHFLADSYLLYLKTQNFHWNVTGPHFPSYHLLFEAQYKELAEAIDVIAERIRALGSFAPASFSEFQKLSSLKEAPSRVSAQNMITILMEDHMTLSHHAALILNKAEKAHDQATMDLLIERMRVHDKAAWMLQSTKEH